MKCTYQIVGMTGCISVLMLLNKQRYYYQHMIQLFVLGNFSISLQPPSSYSPPEFMCHNVQAPKSCENFLALAASQAYDGTIFHRLIPAFMIQGGDPTGMTALQNLSRR